MLEAALLQHLFLAYQRALMSCREQKRDLLIPLYLSDSKFPLRMDQKKLGLVSDHLGVFSRVQVSCRLAVDGPETQESNRKRSDREKVNNNYLKGIFACTYQAEGDSSAQTHASLLQEAQIRTGCATVPSELPHTARKRREESEFG